jgi:hypothetical protein
LIIEPSFTYGYDFDNEIHRIDIHNKFYLTKYGWASISYKNFKQVGIMVVFKVKRSLYIGYNFSGGPKDIGVYGTGTHGIVLGRNLGVSRYTKSDF